MNCKLSLALFVAFVLLASPSIAAPLRRTLSDSRLEQLVQSFTGEENGRAEAALRDAGTAQKEYQRAIRSIRRSSRRAHPALRQYIHRFLRRAAGRWKIAQGDKNLRGADLSQMTGLSGMDLHGLDLRGADLRYANLEYTNLQGAWLRGARLRGARYNRRTRRPAGLAPRRHGAILVR